SPDLRPSTGLRGERIVLRNAIAPVLADGARIFLVVEIRNDPQNLSEQRIEALRIRSHCRVLRFSSAAVPAGDIEDSPVRAAGPRGGIENQIAHRMDAGVLFDP